LAVFRHTAGVSQLPFAPLFLKILLSKDDIRTNGEKRMYQTGHATTGRQMLEDFGLLSLPKPPKDKAKGTAKRNPKKKSSKASRRAL
jgi:hypothetical protein